MKTSLLTTILLLVCLNSAFTQAIPHDSLYFGQTPPGNTPQIFAPGIVSLPNRNEAVITFSPDGASVFFYVQFYPQPGNPYTMYATYSNNHWTVPGAIPFTTGRSTGEPFFAFNGNRVYMFATNVENHVGAADLSYSEKLGVNWSNPVSLGNPPNSEAYQYHPCIVGDTSIYFSSSAGDICRCQYANGGYQSRVILPVPINRIGSQTWGDPYVSPDERYMILKSIRVEGYGQNDLYISYNKSDGTWTNPKNLGNIINTPNDETSGDITPDGKYMTYGRNNDLYWVSTSFIDSLKYTNYIPYIKSPMPNQTAIAGQSFKYTIPLSTFFDDDGNNTLTVNAKLSNGSPLPEWLSFDTLTGTFTGTTVISQIVVVKVTAMDTAGASVSTTVRITVNKPTSINQINGQTEGVRIFPNPASTVVNVSVDSFPGKEALIEIINQKGEVILTRTFKNRITLNLADKPKGLYILKLHIDNDIIIRKVSLI